MATRPSPSAPSASIEAPTGDALAPCRATRERIASMEVRGAGAIAREGSRAMGESALLLAGAEGWRQRLAAGARWVLSSRPTAVSLRNGLNLTLQPMRDGKGPAAVSERAERFQAESRSALERIARHAAKLLAPEARVATHCNSQGALAPLLSSGRPPGITVVATETRPWRQGLLTVGQLSEAGIPATLVVDSAVHSLIADGEVDVVLVGADTVALDGTLVNKVGTLPIARSARDAGIPFHCLAETYKVSPYDERGADVVIEERDPAELLDNGATLPRGVAARNPVFDRTPPALVTSYVTEEGPVQPGGVRELAKRVFGDRKDWI